MIKIGIVEDDPGYQKILESLLLQFQQDEGVMIDIVMFSNGMELVENYTPLYDILLLDISMPLLDGMSAAKRIREKDSAVVIIFITNMKKYAIESYKVGALDYVLKPINYFALQTKLKKSLAILNNRAHHYLMLHVKGAMTRVDVANIYYIEVFNHKLSFYTEQGEYQISATLRSVEEQLDGCHFARCNKCYLVNLRHVTHISSNTVTLSNGTDLVMSRLRKKDFLQSAADYYGGGGQ